MGNLYTIEEITKILRPVFFHNGVRKAILFGSYAKGTQTVDSDIDLLVDSGLSGLSFYGLLEDVAETLNAEFDMIDVSQIIPDSKIDREIKKTGVMIYER
ncbi:MAG: nucleotidyltransferase domain-containing protein [Firmicutes bacterium]|nr:nucleotidyltransferase domain-containing protein [Bacillota bacterium]